MNQISHKLVFSRILSASAWRRPYRLILIVIQSAGIRGSEQVDLKCRARTAQTLESSCAGQKQGNEDTYNATEKIEEVKRYVVIYQQRRECEEQVGNDVL